MTKGSDAGSGELGGDLGGVRGGGISFLWFVVVTAIVGVVVTLVPLAASMLAKVGTRATFSFSISFTTLGMRKRGEPVNVACKISSCYFLLLEQLVGFGHRTTNTRSLTKITSVLFQTSEQMKNLQKLSVSVLSIIQQGNDSQHT